MLLLNAAFIRHNGDSEMKACGRTVLLPLTFVAFCMGQWAVAQPHGRLWILHGSNEVTEYDPTSFAPIQTLRVPSDAVKNPRALSINGKGQMLFVPDLNIDDAVAGEGKIWFWDGRSATLLNRGVIKTKTRVEGVTRGVREAIPQCFLSENGIGLYWFVNEFNKLTQDDGLESSVSTVFRVWQTDPAGRQSAQIANFSFAPCECGTGVCSETCPQADVWVPHSGMDSFFILTDWIPGQLGATYQSSSLYRNERGTWTASKLPKPLEIVLDAVQNGASIVYAVRDAGCCGWDNESNDQTVLLRNGRDLVLFDERARFANPNYDVSFFSSNAQISPDFSCVAMTIASTAQVGADLRLSDGGRPDAGELARIRQALAVLPTVEVLRVGDNPTRSILVHHATLAGWLSEREIAVVQDQVLVAYDVVSGNSRKSPIHVPQAGYVFVR
jgi:hypothetical protein